MDIGDTDALLDIAAPIQHFEAAIERLFPDGFPSA